MNLKKPKFWDYKKPNFISDLLFPLSKLVEVKSEFIKFKKTKFNNIKTICVGNIYLGGTGKTPLVIKINSILKKKYKTAIIKKTIQIKKMNKKF